MVRECCFVIIKVKQKTKETYTVSSNMITHQKQSKVEIAKEVTKIKIDEYGKVAKIRTEMPKQVYNDLTNILKSHYDVLANSPIEMKKVSPKVIVTHLTIGVKPKKVNRESEILFQKGRKSLKKK